MILGDWFFPFCHALCPHGGKPPGSTFPADAKCCCCFTPGEWCLWDIAIFSQQFPPSDFVPLRLSLTQQSEWLFGTWFRWCGSWALRGLLPPQREHQSSSRRPQGPAPSAAPYPSPSVHCTSAALASALLCECAQPKAQAFAILSF